MHPNERPLISQTAIPFTLYIPPHGRWDTLDYEVSKEVGKLASELIEAGYHFDAEILRTGEISLTCERNGEDEECVAIEIVPKNTIPLAYIETLVRSAHQAVKE
jgi:hypothetical protein